MVGGRRKNPRARQGADVQIGPAAKNPPPGYRDRGSGSYDPTGYEVGRECALSVRPKLAGLRPVIAAYRPYSADRQGLQRVDFALTRIRVDFTRGSQVASEASEIALLAKPEFNEPPEAASLSPRWRPPSLADEDDQTLAASDAGAAWGGAGSEPG
jgi:hypothetical protein